MACLEKLSGRVPVVRKRFKEAFKTLKTDESLSWVEPRIRAKGETPSTTDQTQSAACPDISTLPLLFLKIGLRCFQRTSMGGRSRLRTY